MNPELNTLAANDAVPKLPYSAALACDPQRSVIVSACAGSGKTWLLVARMIRLLLDGVKPQEILALTFTRKAAQEMRDRLYGLLEQFSKDDDVQLHKELIDRGVDPTQVAVYLPKARVLYEQVLANPQPIVIDTFHGWFGRLLGSAPVSLGIQPGFRLREDAKRLQEECLSDWWGDLTEELKAHYDVLLKHLGAHETQKFLMGKGSLFKQRGAWTFFAKECKEQGSTPIERFKKTLFRLNAPNPLLALWDAPNALKNLEFLALCLQNSSTNDQKLLPYLLPALVCKKRGGSVMEVAGIFQYTFLTKDPKYRESNDKILGDLKTYLTNEGMAHRIEEHISFKQAWGHAFEEYLQWQAEQDIFAINQAWFALTESMMAFAEAQKENMRVRDFDDLEIGVSTLMADSTNAAYLQARLDARYKQILVDEFQDTNPLQWQILRSWLAGYSEGDDKPKVFIVGDPKQSIYRFRRADPRLFASAKHYLHWEWDAVYIEQDKTRRNAQDINEAVNRIFKSELLPEKYPYSRQETLWTAGDEGRPHEDYAKVGEAYILPLVAYEQPSDEQRSGSAFDDPIIDPGKTVADVQRMHEGKMIGRLINHLLATRQVADKDGGKDIWRKARPSDFLLLVKRRSYLSQYEKALQDAGLAYDSSRLGGLLNTLEVDDLIALLTVFISPRHDLPLAQVLRSPIFGFTEQQMQKLAIAMTTERYRTWWDALQDSADEKIQKAARFLLHWQVLSERLPVHDLLDRIYQEGDVRIRYAAICHERSRAQVLANLDAFLGLALNQDGGQYPSLSRFINEINLKRRGDDDETPDEGDVDTTSEDNLVELDEDSELSIEEQNQCVRLMTIHGAKGLEAPFVIVLDSNNTDTYVDHSGVLMEWAPEEASPSHLSLFTNKTLTSPRTEINDEEKRIGENENWNLLYVAMTRARQGLWISGDAQKPSKKNPDGLDPSSWYGKALKAELPLYKLPNDMPVEEGLQTWKIAQAEKTVAADTNRLASVDDFVIHWRPAIESHEQLLKDIESGVTAQVCADDDRVKESDPEILEEGVYFHKLLEFLVPHSGSTQQDIAMPSEQEVMSWLGVDQSIAQKVLKRAQTVLDSVELTTYLRSGPWIQAWNELDIADEKGRNFRIDRLVEFDTCLAILDYKLTIPDIDTESYSKYQAQLANYQKELARIRPDKPNKAFLISAEGKIKQIGQTLEIPH